MSERGNGREGKDVIYVPLMNTTTLVFIGSKVWSAYGWKRGIKLKVDGNRSGEKLGKTITLRERLGKNGNLILIENGH